MVARSKTKPRQKSAPKPARSRKPSKTQSADARSIAEQVEDALAWLQQASTKKDFANLARFGITATKPFGVSMANIQKIAKRLDQSHELAAALWDTGRYEARLLTAFVDEPQHVTPAQMDRWCRDFDNWGICDTLCFKLFDRTPHAWAKVAQWSERRPEFEKRAGFALLAYLAGHDKTSGDETFRDGMQRIERHAADGRNFVKKAVNWALRGIGRRNRSLHSAALQVAERLAASPDAAARWVGHGALRELTSPLVRRQLAARDK